MGALLRQGVSVSIVHVVTSQHFNFYAAACRWIDRGHKRVLETWSHTPQLGSPLPDLPLCLAVNFAVALELESGYEETGAALRIA